MELKELVQRIYDDITLYKSDFIGGYTDIYCGPVSDIPVELLDLQVGIIGAKKKNMLDIEVR